MSYSCDETYRVYSEQFPKARKPHKCGACKETISAGQKYAKISCVYEGTAETIIRCLRCQTIHEHLREKCFEVNRKYGDQMWPDENLNCGLDYVDEWGELPSEIAELAFALPGEIDKLSNKSA